MMRATALFLFLFIFGESTVILLQKAGLMPILAQQVQTQLARVR